MGTDRVVIGKYLNGTMGLKVSMPGYSALNDDDSDASKFSFNSQWNDLVKIHMMSVVSSYTPITTGSVTHYYIFFPNLGYKPFVEIRRVDGNKFYDDGPASSNSVGYGGPVTSNSVEVNPIASLLCVVYKIPVPVS